jgi:hypothetical protein
MPGPATARSWGAVPLASHSGKRKVNSGALEATVAHTGAMLIACHTTRRPKVSVSSSN